MRSSLTSYRFGIDPPQVSYRSANPLSVEAALLDRECDSEKFGIDLVSLVRIAMVKVRSDEIFVHLFYWSSKFSPASFNRLDHWKSSACDNHSKISQFILTRCLRCCIHKSAEVYVHVILLLHFNRNDINHTCTTKLCRVTRES